MRQVLILGTGALCSGFLLVLSLPPVGLANLAWISVVPLFWAVRKTRGSHGFLAALFACGFGAWLSTFNLTGGRVLEDGSSAWNYVGFILFGGLIGAMSAVVAELKAFTIKQVLLMACLGVCLEWCLLLILPAHIALTQSKVFPMLLIASFGGIWAVSWLVWVVNLSILLALECRTNRGYAAAAGLVAFFVCNPIFSPQPVNSRAQMGGSLFAAVQTTSGVPKELLALTKSKDVSLQVWPELSGLSTAYRGDTKELQELSNDVAFATSFEDGFLPRPHNALSIFAGGKESERYFKRKPFGGERQVHLAGSQPMTVVLPNGIRVGMAICFDSCYPAVMREAANFKNPDLLIVPSLDPNSPTGFIQAVHGAFTPFRAAELGIPIIRSEATGFSQIVDSDGRTLAESRLGEELSIVHRLKPGQIPTVYKSVGDLFVWLCLVAVGIWVSIGTISRYRSTQENNFHELP